MILFVESGRLGNQLFQYAALRTVARESHRLCLLGFDDLRSTMDGIDAKFLCSSRSLAFRLLLRVRPYLDRMTQHQRIYGYAIEREATGGGAPMLRTGLVNRAIYAPAAHFQCEKAFEPWSVRSLVVKRSYVSTARDRLSAFRGPKVFVHVRRGDYLVYPNRDEAAVLPAAWYRECMERFRNRLPGCTFIVVSDDPYYVKDVLLDSKDVVLVSGEMETDFALMCQCDGGILSASSFAWWAAYFLRRDRVKAQFIAPKHWMGHRSKQWHPAAIESSFIEYV